MSFAVQVGDGISCVVVGDTLVSVWMKPAVLSRWQWLSQHIFALAEAQKDNGLVHLMLILPSSDPPTPESRAYLQKEIAKLGPKLRKLVAVALGDSMRTSLVRTVGRSLLFVMGKADQLMVAASLAEAIAGVQAIATLATPNARELAVATEALLTANDIKAASTRGLVL